MKNIVIWLKNWTEREKVKCISKIFETFESHKSSNPKEDNKNDSVDHVVHGHKPFQWNTFVAGFLPIFWKHPTSPPLRNDVGASRFWKKQKGEKLRKDFKKKTFEKKKKIPPTCTTLLLVLSNTSIHRVPARTR